MACVVGERAGSRDELHQEVGKLASVAVRAGAVDLGDGWMTKRGQYASLVLEADARLLRGDGIAQELRRDLAPRRLLPPFVDEAHAPLADAADQPGVADLHAHEAVLAADVARRACRRALDFGRFARRGSVVLHGHRVRSR